MVVIMTTDLHLVVHLMQLWVTMATTTIKENVQLINKINIMTIEEEEVGFHKQVRGISGVIYS